MVLQQIHSGSDVEGGSCPGWETLLQHSSVHLLAHGAVQHNQLTFATIVKSSPYDDRWTNINLCSLHTDIYVLLNQPPRYPSSSICVEQPEPWLIRKYTVSPVKDVPTTMMSGPLPAAPTMD